MGTIIEFKAIHLIEQRHLYMFVIETFSKVNPQCHIQLVLCISLGALIIMKKQEIV